MLSDTGRRASLIHIIHLPGHCDVSEPIPIPDQQEVSQLYGVFLAAISLGTKVSR